MYRREIAQTARKCSSTSIDYFNYRKGNIGKWMTRFPSFSLLNNSTTWVIGKSDCMKLSSFHTSLSHQYQKGKVVKPITILMINDVYEINESQEDGVGGFIGLNRILNKLRNEERAKGHPTIVTVNGDFLSAGLLSNSYKGKHMVDLFNILEIDLCTIGNHDFDYGLDILIERVRQSRFKWVCSNVELLDPKFKKLCEVGCNCQDVEPPKEVVFHRKHIMEYPINGTNLKVGFFGVLTEATKYLTSGLRNDMDKIVIHPYLDVAKKMVFELKHIDKCDLIICISHLDMDQDMELSKIKYLNAILGGHTHFPYIEISNTNNTLIVKSGSDAKYVAKCSLVVEKVDSSSAMQKSNQFDSMIYVDSVGLVQNRESNELELPHDDESDIRMKNMINYLNSQIPADAYQVLAVCETPLSSATNICRTRESTFGNFLCDVLQDCYDCDMVLFNGGGIRADKTYSVGYHIKVIDIMRELPLVNEIISISIKGKYIKKMVELCLAPIDSLGTLGSGLYPQVSRSVKIEYDRKKNPGSRIVSFSINGEELQDDKYYKLVTTNYLVEGGLDGENWLKSYTYDNADGIHVNSNEKHHRQSFVQILKEELPKIGNIISRIENRTRDINNPLNENESD